MLGQGNNWERDVLENLAMAAIQSNDALVVGVSSLRC